MFGRQLEREILMALADEGPLSAVDLAGMIDEHPLTVEQACDRLCDKGDIRSVGSRRYELATSDRHQLTDAEPTRSGSGRSDLSGLAD